MTSLCVFYCHLTHTQQVAMERPSTKRPLEDLTDCDSTPHDSPSKPAKKMKETSATKVCYFMKVPRELRDLVYHHLWMASPYIVSNQGPKGPGHLGTEGIVCGVVYGGVESNHKTYWTQDRSYLALENIHSPPGAGLLRPGRLPHWLLVSKTFLAEGMAKLRLEATWTLRCIDPTSMSLTSAGLLNPALAQRMCINIPNEEHWMPLWSYNPEMMKALQRGNQVKTLVIKVQYFMDRSIRKGILHNDELHLLMALGQGFSSLTELVVQVQLRYEPRSDISQWDPRVYQFRLCKEIPDAVEAGFGRDVVRTFGHMPVDALGEGFRLFFKRKQDGE
ncbi:hypothetical protein BDU57DRAFT_560911 [Ampelomyces quisqualis]|uniref:Uncharacterized protein n=1 Tax=Ampelomyces quisqualis TaxID=50730 RepID=A0A6A5QXE0_AMPQU|nr:hypothetical protein BDU57DRAFT_560911 [Ampelomyces quisqualis]